MICFFFLSGLSAYCKFDFQMSESDFKAVPEVEIDVGVFKYVLIRLYRFLPKQELPE